MHQRVNRETRADQAEYPHLRQRLIGREMEAKATKEGLEAQAEVLEDRGAQGARTPHQSLM